MVNSKEARLLQISFAKDSLSVDLEDGRTVVAPIAWYPRLLHATKAELSAALAILPEEQRETLLMRFLDDMSLDDIAEALEIPPGTVKSRIHNALAKLRADPRTCRYFED